MGQAKNRKKEVEAFIASLTNEERTVFELSKRAYNRIIRAHDFQGACYHITLFLKSVLRREHEIETNAIIGFVNDGTDDVMISHGWLEYDGKKVDIALSNPNHGQVPGPVLILNQKFQEHGTASYSYHLERGKEGDLSNQRLLASDDPQIRMIAQQKENEHRMITEISKSEEKVMTYLNNAPNGATYDRLLKELKK